MKRGKGSTGTQDERLQPLSTYLRALSPGELLEQEAADTERLLIECWRSLDGSADRGMNSYKLAGRLEKLAWEPPILSFVIERHGGFVNGSTRGELQTWHVDTVQRTAEIAHIGRRQLVSMDARLDVKALAVKVARIIRAGVPDDKLKWASPTRVRVLIGQVIPETNRQTTAARRRRFFVALGEELGPHGWHSVSIGSFVKTDVPVESSVST